MYHYSKAQRLEVYEDPKHPASFSPDFVLEQWSREVDHVKLTSGLDKFF